MKVSAHTENERTVAQMREIIFRGKRIDNDEWVEGAFLNDRDGSFYICPAVSDISYGDSSNRRRIGCWYKVDQSTVGQFTGLTDKNGKRIFEGDIVRFAERRLGGEDVSVVEQVAFEESGFCTHRYFLNNWLRSGNTNLEGIEVIGNTHDNPELLEDSE